MSIERRPNPQFGKRRPAAPPSAPPRKRSGEVALLLMGTLAVGTTAYTLMPRQHCEPVQSALSAESAQPATTPPAPVKANYNCTRTWSSSHGGSSGWRYGAYGSDSSSHSSASSSDAGGSHVTRGGFGSFAQAFGFSGHG